MGGKRNKYMVLLQLEKLTNFLATSTKKDKIEERTLFSQFKFMSLYKYNFNLNKSNVLAKNTIIT